MKEMNEITPKENTRISSCKFLTSVDPYGNLPTRGVPPEAGKYRLIVVLLPEYII